MDHLPVGPPSWFIRTATMLMRPRLHLEMYGDPLVDLSSVVLYGGTEAYAAMYVRGRVSNFGLETARECAVFVARVTVNGKLFDDERSPLAWTHENGGAAYDTRSVGRGKKRGSIFDICKMDGRHNEFQILTKRSLRGFDTFVESGLYELMISAEAANWTSIGRMTVTIRYSRQQCDLSVIESESRRRFRIW